MQSRIKELDKIERIELPSEEKSIHFRFPQPRPSGRAVAEFHGVSKSYGTKLVFHDVSFVINRGDRIGLVGVNGAGKSTLIKLLAGEEKVSEGEFRLGHNVEVDYFAQDQYKALDPNARLLDDLASIAPTLLSGQTQLRTLLGSFLFSDDDVFKTIGVLSGGERNRYALARMLLQPRNFVLLDEPTNHLDMQAKDVLLQALAGFAGTVLFVSHDRYFIDQLANRIFEIEGGQFRDYAGNYEDYLWQKENRGSAAEPQGAVARATHERDASAKPAEKDKSAKKVNPILVRQMKQRRDHLEDEIARCETEISASEMALATFTSAEETIRITKQLEGHRTRLGEMMKEWEQLALTLEETGTANLA